MIDEVPEPRLPSPFFKSRSIIVPQYSTNNLPQMTPLLIEQPAGILRWHQIEKHLLLRTIQNVDLFDK